MQFPCRSGLFAALLGITSLAAGQTCTGLCTQQVSCPNGGATSISGTVYAPNGVDPLPNVLVYIPNAALAPFSPGVSCVAAGTPPSGSPLVGTTTAVDGTFTLTNVPVGNNIPLVIQSGRWRRQLTVAATAACANTAFSAAMPKNRSQGDIPLIAVATGAADKVECVLRKVGVDDAEFTNPGGGGRINLYLGDRSPGAQIDSSTPGESTLMKAAAALNQYDVLMLPCQGKAYEKTAAEESDFAAFANAGGRVYSSHYSYVYLDGNPNLPPVANWEPIQPVPPIDEATVDTSFAEGETLAEWLQLVGATTTQGQLSLTTVRHDLNGVIAPTQSWLALNDPAAGNPVMQFVFDTPVGAKNQCGRVLFNEYHVEDPGNISPKGMTFPAECDSGALTPQEKLLEFSLFELTNDGGEPTISPASANFGSEPVGFETAATKFTWTNHSTFAASAAASAASAEFPVVASNCAHVAAGASCEIEVAFKPAALGARMATLTVTSSGPSLTAALTGTGVPDLTVSTAQMGFGSRDVGDPLTETLTLSNGNPGPVNFPGLMTSGDFAATSNCGATVAAKSSCTVAVTFTPSTTGARTGTLAVGVSPPVMLTGNGVDFTFALTPASGSVIAGLSAQTTGTTTPVAGFDAGVRLTCATTAPAVTCTPSGTSFVPDAAVTTGVTITTVSEYTVVGYGGLGGGGCLWVLGVGSGTLLWLGRRRLSGLMRAGLMAGMLGVAALSLGGCSSELPAKHASYTPAGSYTITLSATDGFLVHTATYELAVSAK